MPTTDRLRATLADRYAIEREIGAGGMATVYIARDLRVEDGTQRAVIGFSAPTGDSMGISILSAADGKERRSRGARRHDWQSRAPWNDPASQKGVPFRATSSGWRS
jgi:hypothetical protein